MSSFSEQLLETLKEKVGDAWEEHEELLKEVAYHTALILSRKALGAEVESEEKILAAISKDLVAIGAIRSVSVVAETIEEVGGVFMDFVAGTIRRVLGLG